MQRTKYSFAEFGLSMSYSSDLPIQRRLKPNEIKKGDKTIVCIKDITVLVCKFCPEQHKKCTCVTGLFGHTNRTELIKLFKAPKRDGCEILLHMVHITRKLY